MLYWLNSGRVLEKDELIEKLWPDTFVDEANLTQNIYLLRKAVKGLNVNRTMTVQIVVTAMVLIILFFFRIPLIQSSAQLRFPTPRTKLSNVTRLPCTLHQA